MVASGIEALEYYLEPSTETKADPTPTPPTPSPLEPGGSTPSLNPSATPSTSPPSGDQPAVFCQKGKCYPHPTNPVPIRAWGQYALPKPVCHALNFPTLGGSACSLLSERKMLPPPHQPRPH